MNAGGGGGGGGGGEWRVEREEGLPQLSNCEHRGGWGVQILVIL